MLHLYLFNKDGLNNGNFFVLLICTEAVKIVFRIKRAVKVDSSRLKTIAIDYNIIKLLLEKLDKY